MSRSVKKKNSGSIFLKSGIISIVGFDKQKTVIATWYMEKILPRVLGSLKNEQPHSRLYIWFLHHDNASAHRAGRTTDYLPEVGVKLLGHPPHSPDLAPCDFALFLHVKKQ
ncbi:unnamed protein product [Euphydryas editha]|uniref:Transposase n=1 Tax=Euphydryas editha TaxID=104508 RepID=A0AAU9V7H7_EUPED|nr:unnamed protein product [Euphydryas editha]